MILATEAQIQRGMAIAEIAVADMAFDGIPSIGIASCLVEAAYQQACRNATERQVREWFRLWAKSLSD